MSVSFKKTGMIEASGEDLSELLTQSDIELIGSDHGFAENGDLMKVFENDIWATEFIEY